MNISPLRIFFQCYLSFALGISMKKEAHLPYSLFTLTSPFGEARAILDFRLRTLHLKLVVQIRRQCCKKLL